MLRFSIFDDDGTLGSTGRRVTLHGSGQVVSTWDDEYLKTYVTNELRNNGIGVSSLAVGRSWFNTLTTFDVTIQALASQTRAEVERVITQAFANLAAASPGNLVWNTGPFQITYWEADAGDPPPQGYVHNGGNLGTVTVSGGQTQTTGGGSRDVVFRVTGTVGIFSGLTQSPADAIRNQLVSKGWSLQQVVRVSGGWVAGTEIVADVYFRTSASDGYAKNALQTDLAPIMTINRIDKVIGLSLGNVNAGDPGGGGLPSLNPLKAVADALKIDTTTLMIGGVLVVVLLTRR